MQTKKNSIVVFILLSLSTLVFSNLMAENKSEISQAAARVDINAENAQSISAAGANVTIRGTVEEDIWAAGANVDIDTTTGNNVNLAGARITLKGNIGGHSRLAGAEIDVDAVIEKELNAAAALITTSEKTSIGRDSVLAGALIDFKGAADDNLELHGDEVLFAGQANGSVSIEARQVKIGDGAIIKGDLKIYSIEPADISTTANIQGKVTAETMSAEDFARKFDVEESPFGKLWNKIIIACSAFLLGIVMLFTARNTTEDMMLTLRERPGRSLLWGLAVLFGVPLAAILIMVLVLGLPLGLFMLLTVPLLILIGFTSALLGLSGWLLNKTDQPQGTKQRILFLLLAILIYIVIRMLPVLGGVLVFIAMLFGLGAFVLSFGKKLKGETEVPGFTATPGL